MQALARTGRRDEAESLLNELLPVGGPLGLYGEELDPDVGSQLGNYPQALTHAALVQAVLSLDAAPQRRERLAQSPTVGTAWPAAVHAHGGPVSHD